MIKTFIKPLAVTLLCSTAAFSYAKPVEYKFDIEGAHAFVQFKAKHLGISWLYGRFNDFDGSFVYDPENDANNKVTASVNVTSLDSNHSERDVHLKDEKFLNIKKYKTATFESTEFKTLSKEKAILKGNLTLMGVTKPVEFDVDIMGQGVAPWEAGKNLQRRGFEGVTTINPVDYGMVTKWVGDVELKVSVEGIGPLK